MKEYAYKIRPHHGLCLNFFKGKGYSEEFVKNMTEIKGRLIENPIVCITRQTDHICSVCPNNAAGTCIDEEKVAEYDRQVLLHCNLSDGQLMSFLDFERLVHQHILCPGKRKEICGNCQWDSLCHDEQK